MLERLSKKLDEMRCRTLLGQTASIRQRQIRESNPALSATEAGRVANREAVTSLREEGVDPTSLTEVAAWSQRFLAKAAQTQIAARRDWSDVLRDCDLIMTAAEVKDGLKMMQEEGAVKGETPYYKQEFLEVLYPFMENPSVATAVPLLEAAPFLRAYFEKCSPGGEFYETRRLLGER